MRRPETVQTGEPEGECAVRWESPTRYYWARLHRDLLGDWVVSGCYGGRFNRRVSSYTDGLSEIRTIDRLRLRHGYSRVMPPQTLFTQSP